MDPNACLHRVLDAAAAGDNAEYNDARADYNGWVRRGGFLARVALHPALDCWMMGDRYGYVVAVGTRYVSVRCDRSGRTRRIDPALILYTVDGAAPATV